MIKTGTKFLKINLNAEIKGKEIGAGNRIDVITLPSDIHAFISFVESPAHDKKFPLKNNNSLLLDNDLGGSLYLWTQGTSDNDIEINISTVKNTDNTNNVLISQNSDKVGLDTELSNALLQLNNLDKIINPLDTYSSTFLSASSSASLKTAIFDFIADCDTLLYSFVLGSTKDSNGSYSRGEMSIYIDGKVLDCKAEYTDRSSGATSTINQNNNRIDNIRGKNIKVYSFTTVGTSNAFLTKINLK